MPVRLGRFEMPKRLQKEESTATDTYTKFIADPFETGYGHTIGNSLRRVLLSSLEGAAVTAVRIEKASHEYQALPGVKEDVMNVLLNLKKLRVKLFSNGTEKGFQSLQLVIDRVEKHLGNRVCWMKMQDFAAWRISAESSHPNA